MKMSKTLEYILECNEMTFKIVDMITALTFKKQNDWIYEVYDQFLTSWLINIHNYFKFLVCLYFRWCMLHVI